MEQSTPRLTAREREILQLIAQGHTSEIIAEKLCLSLPTIKWYRKRLRVKFDVGTTVEMVRKALEAGLIE
jgi:two-component system NarL family response regulator